MKINSVSIAKGLNTYNLNKKNIEKKQVNNSKKDTVEISKIGKSLTTYSIEDKFLNSKDRIEKIKKSIDEGTYKVDAKLIAEKMINSTKGKY
ncbi:flagellar biosynthesis anti-sigma factor FlgM [Clostridium niameyense]|uniref:Negative regulator of flagellin synthesis n=1 Tax=Clostridium niameyense TaxID=1622073 RepID=A0A6M0R842_9CLOT|nr:flagellar biosynthesis anti-sigma factor FlgM [Clostridium niameyense]NEZ45860.1 flagellar biosynthesis anti-sigma factor FlgM [Clostridium niameyense]